MVAVVIIGVLMIFIFSLLLVSYTLYASQNKKPASRRNSEAANSLSIAMQSELEQVDAYKESALWKYLRCNVLQANWPYYDPTKPGHGQTDAFRYFDLNYQNTDSFKEYLEVIGEGDNASFGELNGFPGSVEICMYWELPEGTEETDNITDKSGTKLHMEIICETANQTYVVTNHYKLTQTIAQPEEKKVLNGLETSDFNPYQNSIDKTEKWEWVLESRE